MTNISFMEQKYYNISDFGLRLIGLKDCRIKKRRKGRAEGGMNSTFDFRLSSAGYMIPRFLSSQKHFAVALISTAALCASSKPVPKSFLCNSSSFGHL